MWRVKRKSRRSIFVALRRKRRSSRCFSMRRARRAKSLQWAIALLPYPAPSPGLSSRTSNTASCRGRSWWPRLPHWLVMASYSVPMRPLFSAGVKSDCRRASRRSARSSKPMAADTARASVYSNRISRGHSTRSPRVARTPSIAVRLPRASKRTCSARVG